MSKPTYSLSLNEKAVVKDSTGEKMFPNCFADLAPYYSYVLGSKGKKQAQQVLRSVFNGEQVISDLIKHAQGTGK